jgi:predicted ArsR family transcriptional regulator
VYSVTEAGRSTGTSGDAGLAREVLRHLRASLGDEGVRAFAESRLDAQRDRFSVALAEVPLEDRARELARLLTDEGYAASVEEVPGTAIGIQICQHDCPVAQVAAEFPELCDAESRMFAEVLGTHIQRLATIAHGDGVCTTHMPAVLAAAQLSAAQATGSEAESPISAAGPRTRDSDSRSTPFRPLDRSTP